MTREHYLELLGQLDHAMQELGDLVEHTIDAAMLALNSGDVASAQKLIEGDNEIDRRRHEIDEQAFAIIATQQPVASDLRLLTSAFTISAELERIGDYAAGIAKLTLQMAAESLPRRLEDIESMAIITGDLLHRAMRAFKDRDVAAAAAVWGRDDEVDELYESVFKHEVNEMARDTASIRRGTYLLWVAHNIERMADRVTNIAENVAFVVTGDVPTFREGIRSASLPG
ncbi:MAG TPA: phosphate signaling complex protein PhoU [Chloroflexota bacterium]|nr:phosphate signaling complex protein PhoU [Chloroflexota bacterium]